MKFKNILLIGLGGLFIFAYISVSVERSKKGDKNIDFKEVNNQVNEVVASQPIIQSNQNNKLMTPALKYVIAEGFYNSEKDFKKFFNFDPFYSTATIEKEYQQNEVKADNKYLKNRIFIYGNVSEIKRSAFNDRYIVFGNGGSLAVMSDNAYNSTTLKRLKQDKENVYLGFLGELQKGQEVILNCKVSGLELSTVKYNECVPGYAALPYYDYMNKITENKNNNDMAATLYILNLIFKNTPDCNIINNVEDWNNLQDNRKQVEKCLKVGFNENNYKNLPPEVAEELKALKNNK